MANDDLQYNQYKIKINQQLLSDFFVGPSEGITKDQVNEVRKVINIVLCKYYGKYSTHFPDLRSAGMLAVMERRSHFDPEVGRPYNFIYTIFRNELGNQLHSMTKETDVDDMISFQEGMLTTEEADLPPEIARYKDILLGNEQVKMLRIPKKDVLPLTYFLRSHESYRNIIMPEFIKNDPDAVRVLYRIVRDIID